MLKKVRHPLKPIYNKQSKILILGSMPSVKSRNVGFYYAHPQNRFWRILEIIFNTKIEEKELFLLEHYIALWDVISSCEIDGSSDSSIQNVVPNNIEKIIKQSQIKVIFTTGKTAHKYYLQFFQGKISLPVINLPSTSPANCAKKIEDLIEAYQVIKNYLE